MAAAWLCQAPTGSSTTVGPSVISVTPPPARKPGIQSTRCATTSRATQPGTGAGASQSRTPSTRSEKVPATQA